MSKSPDPMSDDDGGIDALTGCADDQSDLGMAVGRLVQLKAPPITSLGDFHVGGSPGDPDVIEVRFVLTDKAEARDWLVWLFEQQETVRKPAVADNPTSKPALDLGRIGRLAEDLRCAGRAVTDAMVRPPGGDAYEYRGSTNSVEWLIEALNNLEHFQAGWK